MEPPPGFLSLEHSCTSLELAVETLCAGRCIRSFPGPGAAEAF